MLELQQFIRRTGADKEKYRKICYEFLDYVMRFRNSDGLLERISGWNFIEWSKANDWVRDVSYPTNMLFSKCLCAIGEMFDDEKLIKYADEIREKVIEQSYNGEFFIDNAIRQEDGTLAITNNISEAGQYYAFFCDVVRPDDNRFFDYYRRVLFDLGPDMDVEKYNIEPARPFIGNYLRMELLLSWQKYDLILDQIKKFFVSMAETTGTLWEHAEPWASTCHGFASYAGVAIVRALFGIKWLDNKNKILYLDFCHCKEYSGSIELACGISVTVNNGKREITNSGKWRIVEC
jgi:alpha-L-rhamnosidase